RAAAEDCDAVMFVLRESSLRPGAQRDLHRREGVADVMPQDFIAEILMADEADVSGTVARRGEIADKICGTRNSAAHTVAGCAAGVVIGTFASDRRCAIRRAKVFSKV